MKYLVTGASGFVGRHLLEHLLLDAEAEIVGIYNQTRPADEVTHGNISWVKRDIVTDELDSILEGVDVVIHLAALSSILDTPEVYEQLKLVNVTGTARLAAAASKMGVPRFIFVSSIAAGEFAEGTVVTETNGVAASNYGKSKKEAEDLLLAMHGGGFNVTILRPTALFGEYHRGSVYELVRLVKKNKFVLIGDGSNKTNFFYIKDFVHDIVSVIPRPDTYGEVFISADEPCELRKLVGIIKSSTGTNRATLSIPLWMGAGLGLVADLVTKFTGKNLPISSRRVRAMTRDISYSAAKLRTVLGTKPVHGLPRGLESTIKWYGDSGMLD